MKQFIHRLIPTSRFGRSVSLLGGGTVLSQAIIVAASPFLTRLYTTDDFGIFSLYTSILLVVGILCCLRYHLAIPLPREDRDAVHLVLLCLAVSGAVALAAVLVVALSRDSIARVLSAPRLGSSLWLLPASILAMGAYQTFNLWAIREKCFSRIAGANVSRATSLAGTQLLAHPFGALALITGRLVGDTVAAVSIGSQLLRKYAGRPCSIAARRMRVLAWEHRAFPLVSTWNGLCNSGSRSFPVLLIGYYLGVAEAGIYGFTFQVLATPMTMIGKAVGDVFYSEAVDAHHRGGLGTLMAVIHKKLAGLALPAATFGFLVAPYVFVVVFGRDWQLAGEVARPMIVWRFASFITSPPTRVYPIIDRQGIALFFQIALLLAGVGSVLLGYRHGLVITVTILSLSCSVIYLLRLLLTFRLCGVSPATIVANTLRPAFAALAVVSPTLLSIYVLGRAGFPDTVFSICFAGSLAMLILYYLKAFGRLSARSEDIRHGSA